MSPTQDNPVETGATHEVTLDDGRVVAVDGVLEGADGAAGRVVIHGDVPEGAKVSVSYVRPAGSGRAGSPSPAQGRQTAIGPLFRPEVFKSRARPLMGIITIAQPLSIRVVALASMMFVAAVVLFLVFGSYTGRSRVVGALSPDTGLVHVTARDNGMISAIFVAQDQNVEAGAPLFKLHVDRDAGGGEIAKRLLSQLEGQRKSLSQERDRLSLEQDIEANRLTGDLARRRLDVDTIRGQIAVLDKRIEIASAAYERNRALAEKGYSSAAQVQEHRDKLLTLNDRWLTLKREQTGLASQIDSLESESAALPSKFETRRAELTRRLAQVEQEIANTELRQEILVRAPVAGTISALVVRPGQMVTNDRRVLTILPAHSVLEAHLYAPSRAMGFVQRGQKVQLRYDPFPYQKFGQFDGVVKSISQVTINNAGSGFSGLGEDGGMYRIIVSLEDQVVTAGSREFALLPDMKVEGDIMLERRRLYQWLFGRGFSDS